MKKIKEVITLGDRISLFQTAMNNAGRNYEGKGVLVERMSKFASDYYKLAIKEIGIIGSLELSQLRNITKNSVVKKQLPRKGIKSLLQKAKVARLNQKSNQKHDNNKIVRGKGRIGVRRG